MGQDMPAPETSFSSSLSCSQHRELLCWAQQGQDSAALPWRLNPPPAMSVTPAQLSPGCCILFPVLCRSRHAAQQDKPGTRHPQMNFFTASSLGKIRLFIY